MKNTEYWNELKEFECCKRSELAFRALVALLDTWPAGDQAEAIARADQILSQWPDAVRVAPWSWCKAASKGIVLPTWQLVRSLQLNSGHLTKGEIDLVRLANHAPLEHISKLEIPTFSDFKELSLLHHRPDLFPGLKHLRATDKYDDADLRAISDSSLWSSLEEFETESLTESFAHDEPSRIVPKLNNNSPLRHVSLRACDLMDLWDANKQLSIHSVGVFIRSIEEAKAFGARRELSQLKSLAISFRCSFSGHSPFEPFMGNVIEADEAAAEIFFGQARLDQLEKLAIAGYSMGYWGREGLGRLGLDSLIASGLLGRLKHLRLERLPLGDAGVESIAQALGMGLESLELVDVYCKGKGAAALVNSPCMNSLRLLDLSGNRIDAAHIASLASASMPNLESLDLSGPEVNPYYWNVGVQPIMDAGAAAWANSDNVKRLKQLRMSNCHLTESGLEAIFRSPKLQALTELDLSHNSFATGLSQIVDSPLWQKLETLKLNHCRLGNDAMEALVGVTNAPALRSLELAYNSIGPRGAAALASWPVLARVWQLNLHDNIIGDEGLVALAKSPNLHRLLELDLEQDCWNSRAFTFNAQAAETLANSNAFSRLDSIFSGCVDEYHGAAYSPGFTIEAIETLRKSPWMRPSLQTAISDFSGIDENHEQGAFDEHQALKDDDFRGHPFELNERESVQAEHRMQQLSSPREPDQPFAELPPPAISPLPEVDAEEDIIEGLGSSDPIPLTDHFAMMKLSFEDEDRPLPKQVGKYVGDILGSIFRARSLGSFNVGGGSSRQAEDGQYIPFDVTFYVGIAGEPEPALDLIRQVLWWINAPNEEWIVMETNSGSKDWTLSLSEPNMASPTLFLQLALPTITRWKDGHRIDRLAFSEAQRQAITEFIDEAGELEVDQGWVKIVTPDGGMVSIYNKYLEDADDFDSLNLLVDALTRGATQLIYRIMQECGLMLFPMAIAADDLVAQTLDCEWPEVKTVASFEAMNGILVQGPYAWWRGKGLA